MTPAVLRSFSAELEKMAWDQAGLRETYEPRVKKFRDSVEKGTFVPKLEGQPGYVERPGFFGGIGRNLRATGRRLVNPQDMARRVKGSFTNKAVPVWQRGLNTAFAASTVLNAVPKEDPSGEGKSRLRRALGGIGGTIGGTVGKGVSGGILGAGLLGGAGDLVGKGIDKLRGYKHPPVKPQEVQT